MSSPIHVIIIGAGLIGLSCADALQKRGARVTVMDRRSGPGEGAGYKNSGMIHPSQSFSWFLDDIEAAKAVLQLARVSKPLIQHMMKTLNLPDAVRNEGCAQIFDHDLGRQAARGRYEALGIEQELTECFERPALVFPQDASGDAYLYSGALALSLQDRGVEFQFNAGPINFGEISELADHIIVAAGAESPMLLADLNISLPIRPVIGHALNFKKPSDVELPGIPVMHAKSHSAMTVFEDHIRLSGTIGEADPLRLLDIWSGIIPDLRDILGHPTEMWSGMRPVCEYGRPIISSTPLKGLWVNTGHGHMGWTLCAGSGALMADMILEGRDVPQFSIN